MYKALDSYIEFWVMKAAGATPSVHDDRILSRHSRRWVARLKALWLNLFDGGRHYVA